MEKKLSVKNLVVSFRTPGGKVQAVRNISFDLNKGETLSIVGESGSGKSVTSKAILGILAGNSIIEGGSILYDGMDLLKIGEDEFYHIRGDRIAMIFQDPLSSLNPIMRIGKQLTEAMLLKGKAHNNYCARNYNEKYAEATKAIVDSGLMSQAEAEKLSDDAKKAQLGAVKRELTYNAAHENAVEAADEIEDILFHIEKNAFTDRKYTIRELIKLSEGAKDESVVSDAAKLDEVLGKLKSVYKAEIKENKDYPGVVSALNELSALMKEALGRKTPDFYSEAGVSREPVENFRKALEKACEHSGAKYLELKKQAVAVIDENRHVFEADVLNKVDTDAAGSKLKAAISASIDPMEIHKDGLAYTFAGNLDGNLKTYFEGIIKNKKAEKEHDKQQKKYDSLVARGKTPTWEVIPSAAVDLDVIKDTILLLIDRVKEHYEELIATFDQRNYAVEAEHFVEYLQENARGMSEKVTKEIAKYRALKLMEEVGISDVRKRYYQYPFEFSGGMRQRIVIAIALAANPDILICDEPTTALDVTIQAQILELINKIKRERNLSIIFITHDLGVVANMADRIAVMYAGKIVEVGTASDVFYSPAHPYTWALLSAMPDTETNERLEAIPGTPPNMIYPPVGDAFADRNKYALKVDFKKQPPMFKISDTHSAATWLLHPDAPHVDPPKAVTDRIERMKKKREEGETNG